MSAEKEFQSDRNSESRSKQRSRFLEPLSPSIRRLISDFISPEKKINPSEPTFNNKLRQLTETFGENTHILLFGLAATASTPQELSNVFVVLSFTGRTDWYQGESIKNLVNILATPSHLPISQEAKDISRQLLVSGDGGLIVETIILNALSDNTKCPFLMETFFNILTSPAVTSSTKEKMVRHLNLFSATLETRTRFHSIFNSDASFWEYVDINWLYSPGKKILDESQPEDSVDNPFALRQENERLRELLAESINEKHKLQQKLQDKETEAARLRFDGETAARAIENLERRLAEERGVGKSSKLTLHDAYKLLGLDDNHDPQLALRVITELSILLHPDSLRPELERKGKSQEIVSSTLRAATQLLRQVNNAKDVIKAATPGPKPQP